MEDTRPQAGLQASITISAELSHIGNFGSGVTEQESGAEHSKHK